MTEAIRVEVAAGVATLTLNRPAKRNAMTAEMWRALPYLLEPLARDSDVRALVLTGAGGVFCAGADLSEISALAAGDDDTGLTVAAEHALATFPKPVIAMIEGYCVGGGCQLALACDIRIAADDTRFGITPAKLGIVYPLSSTRRLVDLVGPGAAKLMLYSADLFDAAWAARAGLVEETVPAARLHERVYGLAATLTTRSRLTLAAAKEIIDGRAGESRFREWQKTARESGESAEGVAAFLERRSPNFK